MNAHLPNASLSLAMLISAAAYRCVVGVEHLVRFCRRGWRAGT